MYSTRDFSARPILFKTLQLQLLQARQMITTTLECLFVTMVEPTDASGTHGGTQSTPNPSVQAVFYKFHHGDSNAGPKNRLLINSKHINTKYYMCRTVLQSYMAIGHVPAPPYRLKKDTHFRENSSVLQRCWSHHCYLVSLYVGQHLEWVAYCAIHATTATSSLRLIERIAYCTIGVLGLVCKRHGIRGTSKYVVAYQHMPSRITKYAIRKQLECQCQCNCDSKGCCQGTKSCWLVAHKNINMPTSQCSLSLLSFFPPAHQHHTTPGGFHPRCWMASARLGQQSSNGHVQSMQMAMAIRTIT